MVIEYIKSIVYLDRRMLETERGDEQLVIDVLSNDM